MQPYGSAVTFVSTREEFDSLGNEGLPEGSYNGGFDSHRTRTSAYVIGVFDGSIFTLIHEAVHAASRLLQDCGIDPQSNEAEPLAYLVDHLVAVGARRLKLSHLSGSGVTPAVG